jgi:hypothetical protein
MVYYSIPKKQIIGLESFGKTELLNDFLAIEENGWIIYGFSKKHKKIRILKINNSLFKEEIGF